MKAIKSLLSGLLLSALIVLPASVRAAELDPFFTVKVSSINTIVSIAEKIGTMAGFANSEEFREFVAITKGIKGVDLNGIFGFAAAVSEDGDMVPILLLPVTDLWRAEIPGSPEIFDSIRPFLVRRGEGRFEINSPVGTYIAVQNQTNLLIVPEDAADQIPADPKKLFADLDKYTIGTKLDLEKVEFETIESTIFGPLLLMAMMSDPAAGEQLENAVEIYRELYKEIAAFSYGIAFNPRTADTELSFSMVARKGSDMAKSFAGYKQQPTMFGGFLGAPNNTVFSIGDSATRPAFQNDKILELNAKSWDVIFEGILEQIEMEDETGDLSAKAKEVVALLEKIFVTETKRGKGDFAFSLNTDATLLCAADTGSLAEIQKIAEMATAFAASKVEDEVKAIVEKNVNLGYTTVEGFKVSSIKIPVISTIETVFGPAPDNRLSDLTLGVFWAAKEGNQQAIAVAAGLDFAKAEQTFKAALTQTKTAVPVRKPRGVFSMAGMGKLLQEAVYPIAVKAAEMDNSEDELEIFRKVIEILVASGNDATITLDGEVKTDRMDGTYRVSGKVIQTCISLVKLGMEQDFGSGGVIIRDF